MAKMSAKAAIEFGREIGAIIMQEREKREQVESENAELQQQIESKESGAGDADTQPDSADDGVKSEQADAADQGNAAGSSPAADPAFQPVNVDAVVSAIESLKLEGPTVNFDLEGLAAALLAGKTEPESLSDPLAQIAKGIESVTEISFDTSSISEAILKASGSESIDKLTETIREMVGQQTESIAAVHAGSIESLAKAFQSFTDMVSKVSGDQAKAVKELSARIDTLEKIQLQAIEIAAAPRRFTLDEEGNPDGYEIKSNTVN